MTVAVALILCSLRGAAGGDLRGQSRCDSMEVEPCPRPLLLPGSPSVTADTDDRLLIETNVPIRQLVPHILFRTLAELTPTNPPPPRPLLSLCIRLPRCSPNLFIITHRQADS